MLTGVFVPLQNRDYRFLITANLLWWQVRWMEMIVNGWIALELTDSPWMVALIGFYRSVPALFAGLFAGPVIDRFGRRSCSQVAQSLNLLIVGAITLVLWLGWLRYWHLAAASVPLGVLWSLDWAARRSLIPDLVGKQHTVDAMLLENFAQNISNILGPLLSGAFLALFGGKGGYSLIALFSLFALIALLGLSKQPIPRESMPQRSPPWQRIRSGLRYVTGHPALMGVMWITLIMNFLAFPYLNILSVFARDVLDLGPLGLGILGSANGVGALVGLLVVNRIRHRIGNQWILVVGSGFYCLMVLLFSLSTNFYLSLGLLALAGLGRICFGVMQSSILLLTASDEMRSRAVATLSLFIGTGPFGQMQIGALAEGLGAPLAVFLHSCAALLALIVMTALSPGYRNPELAKIKTAAGD